MSKKDEGSSKKDVKNVEGLSELLDDALKGFTDRPRTTDDELDEIMAEQDQAAAQRAAGEFQAMLQQMVKVQEEALRQAESSGQQAVENDKEAKEMIEAMKALMESSGKIANASSPDDFVAGLDMLKAPGSPMEPFMAMILQTLASKAVMYPPLKEIHDNYPAYFKEHGSSLDNDTRQRYEKQYEFAQKVSQWTRIQKLRKAYDPVVRIVRNGRTVRPKVILGKICHEFENQPDEPAPASSTANDDIPNMRMDSNSTPDLSNFETLGKLLVELQTYGYPPKELTGDLPPGWAVDDTTGLPKVDDVSTAANSCTLM